MLEESRLLAGSLAADLSDVLYELRVLLLLEVEKQELVCELRLEILDASMAQVVIDQRLWKLLPELGLLSVCHAVADPLASTNYHPTASIHQQPQRLSTRQVAATGRSSTTRTSLGCP